MFVHHDLLSCLIIYFSMAEQQKYFLTCFKDNEISFVIKVEFSRLKSMKFEIPRMKSEKNKLKISR